METGFENFKLQERYKMSSGLDIYEDLGSCIKQNQSIVQNIPVQLRKEHLKESVKLIDNALSIIFKINAIL